MDFSAQIAVIATFAALISALGTMLTLLRLRRSEQANFFLEITDRYNTPEMQDAMSQLVIWYKINPDDFVERWIKQRGSGNPEMRKLEAQRRMINRYFINISQLYQSGYIDKKLAHAVANHGGLNVWYKIVTPMTRAVYNTGTRYPENLKKILPQFADGAII